MRGVTVWDRVCLGLVSASHLSRDKIGPPWLTVAEGSSCYTQVPVLVPGWQTRTRQRVGVWLFLLALKELPRRGLRPTAFLWRVCLQPDTGSSEGVSPALVDFLDLTAQKNRYVKAECLGGGTFRYTSHHTHKWTQNGSYTHNVYEIKWWKNEKQHRTKSCRTSLAERA